MPVISKEVVFIQFYNKYFSFNINYRYFFDKLKKSDYSIIIKTGFSKKKLMNLRNIFKVAGLIGLITVLSKVTGFFRDVIIAGAYGASLTSDAYFYAYQIPAITLIILGGLGGPFHTVTVSVFSKQNRKSGSPASEVERALNSFLNITGLGFLAITVLIFFNSGLIAQVIAAGGSPELHQMISEQLKIMSPVIFIGGVVGILFGISNVYEKFLVTAVSPIVTSIVIIVAVLFAGGQYGGLVLAWATLIGAVFQMVIQIPAYLDAGFRYKFDINLKDKNVGKIGEILFPAALGCSIGQINVYVDMFFASQLVEGSWSAIGYANRIFQFPVGVLITAMMISIFPTFSELAGKQDLDNLRYYFHKGIKYLWFASFPVFVFMAVFTYETIKILFERGNFDAADTLMVTEALFFLSFAIIFYVGRDTLTRVFYAFDDTKTPFLIALISIFFKALFNFILVKPLGIGGICLSTVIVSAINGLLLAFLIRKKIDLNFKEILPDFSKIVLATAVMTGFIIFAKMFFTDIFGDGKLYMALNVIISCSLASVLYFSFSLLLKIEPAIQLVEKIRLKFIQGDEAD